MLKKIVRLLAVVMLAALPVVAGLIPDVPVSANGTDGHADLSAASTAVNTYAQTVLVNGTVPLQNIWTFTQVDGKLRSYNTLTNTWTDVAGNPLVANYPVSMWQSQDASANYPVVVTQVQSNTGHAFIWSWTQLSGWNSYYSAGSISSTYTGAQNTSVWVNDSTDVVYFTQIESYSTNFVVNCYSHSLTTFSGSWANKGSTNYTWTMADGKNTTTDNPTMNTVLNVGGTPYWAWGSNSSVIGVYNPETNTQTTHTVTFTGGQPAGATRGYWTDGTYIYALETIGTNISNSGTPTIYKLDTSAWTWNFFTTYDFGNTNLRGDTLSSFEQVPALQSSGVLYFGAYSCSVATSAVNTILRVYTNAPSGVQAQIPARHATGTAVSVGSISSIAWQTPRAMFADEQSAFLVTGTANLTYSPYVVNGQGQTIGSVGSDQIGNDGGQIWTVSLPSTFTGFWKLVDQKTSASSTWGYCTSPKVTTYTSNHSYAKYLDSVATRQLASYQATPSEIGIFAWKTDIGGGFLPNYEIRIMLNGSTGDNTYTQTMADYISSYASIGYAQNNVMAGTRYVLFSFYPASGASNWDGLVINLNKDQNIVANQGFYECAVVDQATGLTRYTTTQSVYWYSPLSPMFSAAMNKTGYSASESFTGTINLCSIGVMITQTGYDTLKWYVKSNDLGTTYTTTTDTDRLLQSNISGIVPAASGTYWLQAELSKAGSSIPNASAYYQFSVGSGVAGGSGVDPLKQAGGMLDQIGMNNVWGKMAVVIVAMLIAFLIPVFAAGPHHLKMGLVVGISFALLVFGLGLVTGWMPWVIVVALGLGAAFTIMKLVLSMRSSGAADD